VDRPRLLSAQGLSQRTHSKTAFEVSTPPRIRHVEARLYDRRNQFDRQTLNRRRSCSETSWQDDESVLRFFFRAAMNEDFTRFAAWTTPGAASDLRLCVAIDAGDAALAVQRRDPLADTKVVSLEI
jgi:hypothetical protein